MKFTLIFILILPFGIIACKSTQVLGNPTSGFISEMWKTDTCGGLGYRKKIAQYILTEYDPNEYILLKIKNN